MNKKQMRAAVAKAIQFSDERDVERIAQGKYEQLDRSWARLSSFLVSFTHDLGESDALLAEEIRNFMELVRQDKNPLLDAADSNKEQTK